MDEAREANRRLWAEWTAIHQRTPDMYDLESFKRGGVRIRPWEVKDVGDVAEKDLLHLQCHFGIDTLSWARLGARATGVDFSPEAIALARRVAEEISIDATFVCADLDGLPEALEGDFDVVYSSRGVLNWLPDIEGWARVVAHFLRPGGFLYLHEGHPLLFALADRADLREGEDPREPLVRFPYFGTEEPLRFPVHGSYADPEAEVREPFTHEWPHGLGEIVTAVAEAGLRVELLRELPHLSWPRSFLERRADGEWWLPEDFPGELPLMFSLRARKPG